MIETFESSALAQRSLGYDTDELGCVPEDRRDDKFDIIWLR